MTTCVPQITNQLSCETLNRSQSAASGQGLSGVMSSMLQESVNRCPKGPDNVETLISYVSKQIIAMLYPSEIQDSGYALKIKHDVNTLQAKHGNSYILVLNLSEKRQELISTNVQVSEFGWPHHLPPPLESLCSLCKTMDIWLCADLRNILVLHCKGGSDRLATVMTAYTLYKDICISRSQSLDKCLLQHFHSTQWGPLLPSQERYTQHFAGLLSGSVRLNNDRIFLHHILIHGVPNFDTVGGCRPFIRVYQGMQPMFTSGVYTVTDNMQKVCISISPGIPLHGDILIKCYHKISSASGAMEVIWQCQFHTCTIENYNLLLGKQDLDDAVNDHRFPSSGKVEFVFGATSEGSVSVSGFKSDVTVPVDYSGEPCFDHGDSYDAFYRAAQEDRQPQQRQPVVNQSHSSSQQHPLSKVRSGSSSRKEDACRFSPQRIPNNCSFSPSPPHHLPNGSLTSSLDSGYVGTRETAVSTPARVPGHHVVNTFRSTEDFSEHRSTLKRHYSNHSGDEDRHFNAHTHRYPVSQQQTRSTAEDQNQLDNLLSDLMQEHVLIDRSKCQGRIGTVYPDTSVSSSKAITMTTHKWYSQSTSEHSYNIRRPADNLLIQRAEVTYKAPGQDVERQLYTITGVPSELERSCFVEQNTSYRPDISRKESDLLTVDCSVDMKKRRDGAPNVPSTRVQSPSVCQQPSISPPRCWAYNMPFRADYESRLAPSTAITGSSEDCFAGDVWLQRQQDKLHRMREGRGVDGRTEQERKLVKELRSAQDHYYRHRANGEAEEMDAMDKLSQCSNLQVAPSSAPPYSCNSSHSFRGKDSLRTSSSHYMEQERYYGGETMERSSSKPPPSPTAVQRSMMMPSSVLPPTRSTSKDYMRSRSNSSSNAFSSGFQGYNRSITRHHSDTGLEPDYLHPHHALATHSTPPSSPGTRSPTHTGPTATTTYTTYRTIHRDIRDRIDHSQQPITVSTVAPHSVHHEHKMPSSPPLQSDDVGRSTLQQSWKNSSSQLSSSSGHVPIADAINCSASSKQESWSPVKSQRNYVTEVFVHRGGGEGIQNGHHGDDMVDSTLLDELTRSMQSATNSINNDDRLFSARQGPSLQQKQQQQLFSESRREGGRVICEPQLAFQNYLNNQSSSQASNLSTVQSPGWDNDIYTQVQKVHKGPPPKPISVVEEDRIALIPIGPGMQMLEPELSAPSFDTSSCTGVASTPSFPITPVTPPFPVSPRTDNRGGLVLPSSSSPSHVTSPHDCSPLGTAPWHAKCAFLTSPAPEAGTGSTSISLHAFHYSDPLYATIPEQRIHSTPAAGPGAAGTLGAAVRVSGQETTITRQSVERHRYQADMAHDSSLPALNQQPENAVRGDHIFQPTHVQQQPLQSTSTTGVFGDVISSRSLTGQGSPSVYLGLSRRGSMTSLADPDMTMHCTPKFVRDTSKIWYRPEITREEAIAMLRECTPGTFLVRDSNSFPGAYGLALKVSSLPANVHVKSSGDSLSDLVRHFLIEPSAKGVRLRGNNNEPTFGSLAALIYQHSITPLSLPCKLLIPDDTFDSVDSPVSPDNLSPVDLNSAASLLAKGAACNVIFLNSVDTESLTGPKAIDKAIRFTIGLSDGLKCTVVHFKVSRLGITLTDNNRRLFFRRHYPVSAVTFCGLDPHDRRWKRDAEQNPNALLDAKIFGFVARKQAAVTAGNMCHLFAELDPEQPASAIVNFVSRVMIGQKKVKP